MKLAKLKRNLIKSEGLELKAYKDTVGKTTIGVGRNLDDVGITRQEAMVLLDNDLRRLKKQLAQIKIFPKLSECRQLVIAELAFNLGLHGLMQFKKMWEAIYLSDWEKAADEMLDSLWAKQVGKRAKTLASRMRKDED